MSTFLQRRDLYARAAAAVYGPRWRGPLAEALGLNERTVRGWFSLEPRSCPPPPLADRLEDHLRSEIGKRYGECGEILDALPLSGNALRDLAVMASGGELFWVRRGGRTLYMLNGNEVDPSVVSELIRMKLVERIPLPEVDCEVRQPLTEKGSTKAQQQRAQLDTAS